MILFFPTNLDVFKYGFKKTVTFELLSISKLQFTIIDKSKMTLKKKENKKADKVLENFWIFGGSTTYGNNCEREQSSSWPDEIKKINENFTFKNFAFNGANSDQSIVLFFKNILKYQPKAIIWSHKTNIINIINKKNYKNKDLLNYDFSKSSKNKFFLNIKRIDKTIKQFFLSYVLLDEFINRVIIKLENKGYYKKITIEPTSQDLKFAIKNFELNLNEVIKYSKKAGVEEFYIVSLFYIDDEKLNPNLKKIFPVYENRIQNIEKKYSPYVKVINEMPNLDKTDKKIYFCDNVHQKLEGNIIQAQIINKNLKIKSNFYK
tara:strand:+ start:1383 stop:2339 length:957 start_codon:yes stop_codon:yes gene_type:complete